MSEFSKTPETSDPTQLTISSMNIWRWQAERVATELITAWDTDWPEADTAHDLARIFDNADQVQLELHTKPAGTHKVIKLDDYMEGCMEIKHGEQIRTAAAVSISDYEEFRTRLANVGRINPKDSYLRTTIWFDPQRTEQFKDTLLTILDMTSEGFIRTNPRHEAETSRKLGATVMSLDFSTLKEQGEE